MNKEYIVGIDYGHGETAAWIVPICHTTMDSKGESLRIRIANNGDNDRIIHSVVYKTKGGEYDFDRPEGTIFACMKGLVSDLNNNLQRKVAYQKYIKLVLERLLQANSVLKHENGDYNFYLCTACPTRWEQKDKEAYLAFFNEALAPLGIRVHWIINESDAAFFTHKPQGNNSNQCIIVIDYGSSTVDYTVLCDGKKISNDEWSNPHLGASCIEKAILEDYRRNGASEFQQSCEGTQMLLNEIKENHISILDTLDYECRKAKETAYTTNKPITSIDYNFKLNTGDIRFGKHRFEYDCRLNNVIENYKSAVKSDFVNLKNNIRTTIGYRPIDRIILSGGACIMPWVKIAVKEVFDVENDIIVDDRTPGYVVAKGIALYAQAQVKALEILLSKISSLPFGEYYKQADQNATATAAKSLIPTVVNDIKYGRDINGNEIRQRFCNFIKTLGPNNELYSDKFLDIFKCKVNAAISENIKSTIKEVFNANIDTDDIDICIEPIMSAFVDECFVPGGGWYDGITIWINNAADTFFDFDWFKDRDSDMRAKIANGTSSSIIQHMETTDFISYAPGFLDEYGKNMCEQALIEAEGIFYQKQLFKTTFTK